MTIREQIEVLGLSKKMKEIALDREHSVPFIFNGNKSEKMKLNEIVKKSGLSIHEGGRMINLCDKVSKAEAMKKIIKICKKIEQKKLITIAVGDNFNDLEMLKSSNIPCLVFNDKFKKNKINIKDCLVSKKSSPEGWEEVVKLALEKINIKV